MSDKKGWASTVAGWFIERDEAPIHPRPISDVLLTQPPRQRQIITPPHRRLRRSFKKRRRRRPAVRSTLPPFSQQPASTRTNSNELEGIPTCCAVCPRERIG